MKNLSTNKMVALAACAAATATATASAASSTTNTNANANTAAALPAKTKAPATSTSTAATSEANFWLANRISRGGSSNNADDGGGGGGGGSNHGKSKKSSSKKKKKSSAKQNARPKRDGPTASPDAAPETKTNPLLEEILGHDDFYEVLGVSGTASEREIQKAYRKRCVQTHPDKTGGDRRAFDKVAEAYDVLSEPTKRQLYNRYGKEGLDPTSAAGGAAAFGGGAAGEMFRNMFQQAQQQRQQQHRRNQTLRYQLEVTLEDLYSGRTQSVMVTPPHSRYQSPHQQRQRRKEVEVHIQKGMVSGQSIVMSGEVDFNDDNSPPGDLVFILTQAPHATFTRKGHDLAMELTITLEEALCGLRRPIRHLDGSQIWIESATTCTTNQSDHGSSSSGGGSGLKKKKKTQQHHDAFDESDNGEGGSGDIPATIPIAIQTGDVQVLKGRGMPKRNRNGEFGDLYIQYRVEMPQTTKGNTNGKPNKAPRALTMEEYQELARLLSKLDGTRTEGWRAHPRSTSPSGEQPGDGPSGEPARPKPLPPPEIHSLREASSSDFGSASGRVEWDEEHEDHGDEYHPFASGLFGGQGFGARTFSQSFHFGGPGATGATGNPFGGYGNTRGGDDDDGNVQCQQM